MRTGGLRDRVKILKRTVVVDQLGHPVESWGTIGEVWGELKEEKGSEVLQNDRPVAFKRALVFIRYHADVTVQNRLTVRGNIYEIESIRTLENNRRAEGLELVVRAND